MAASGSAKIVSFCGQLVPGQNNKPFPSQSDDELEYAIVTFALGSSLSARIITSVYRNLRLVIRRCDCCGTWEEGWRRERTQGKVGFSLTLSVQQGFTDHA